MNGMTIQPRRRDSSRRVAPLKCDSAQRVPVAVTLTAAGSSRMQRECGMLGGLPIAVAASFTWAQERQP